VIRGYPLTKLSQTFKKKTAKELQYKKCREQIERRQ
jgi:hypothetical protein